MIGVNVHYREVLPGPTIHEDAPILTKLRLDCGWKADAVPTWIVEIAQGHRLMWLIYDQPYLKPNNQVVAPLPIGMISLCLFDPKDPTLANFSAPDESIRGKRAEVSSLFVYPEYRGRGVGTGAINYVEKIAVERGVDTVTMNTAAASRNLPRYLKLGYEEYKPRERKYPLHEILASGWTEEHCYAAFLEKRVA